MLTRSPECSGKSSSSLLLSSLELSDTTIYEPYIRALLGTASHFCQVNVLKLESCRFRSHRAPRDSLFESGTGQTGIWFDRGGGGGALSSSTPRGWRTML